MKKTLVISSFMLLVILGLMGYYFVSNKKTGTPTKKTPAARANGTWIIADTSMSMRGYFRTMQYPGSTVQRFLWNGLIPILRESFPTDTIYFSSFSCEIGTPKPVNSLLDLFRFQNSRRLEGFFSGTETKLLEVFENVRDKSYSVFIVVTDGIPSSKGDAGPDPRLIEAIKSLVEKTGYYLWLIAIRSEFKGRIYPQCPNRYGQKRSFEYVGNRPIFIWVGARNKEEGTRIIASSVKKLKLLSRESSNVKFVDFSPPDLPNAELTIGKTVGVLALKSKNPIELRIARNRNRREIDIPLQVRWYPGELRREKESFIEISPRDFQGVRIMKSQYNLWHLLVAPQHLSKRPLKITLKAKLKMDKWWIDWSTDDDSKQENGNRTLYLKQLINPFVEKYLAKLYTIAEIHVVIRLV